LPFRPAGTQIIRCRQKSVNHKLDSLTNEQTYLVAIQINNDLFYLNPLNFFMPYMPCSDINETEESPFAYVELSHVIDCSKRNATTATQWCDGLAYSHHLYREQ